MDILLAPEASPSRAREEIHPEVRTLHIARRGRKARHLILYRVTTNTIDVGRLLHDSMELRRHLPEGFVSNK